MAVGLNGELGKENKLLDHVPEDLKYFKSETMGLPVVMGSKTFFGLPKVLKGKGLPGRSNIILTRQGAQGNLIDSPVNFINSVHEIKELLQAGSYCVIGGAEVYAQFEHLADEVHVTRLNKRYRDADVFYNTSYLDDESKWKLKHVVKLTDKIHVDVYKNICK